MKYSFGISSFLEEISSLSHSVVFLYFFALITEKGFLISLCYSLELCILSFSPLLFASLLFTAICHWSGKQWMHGSGAAERRYPTSKIRSGGPKEIPHVQSKEQQLHFAGAAMKRYPTSKVRETQVRQWALREGIRGQTD